MKALKLAVWISCAILCATARASWSASVSGMTSAPTTTAGNGTVTVGSWNISASKWDITTTDILTLNGGSGSTHTNTEVHLTGPGTLIHSFGTTAPAASGSETTTTGILLPSTTYYLVQTVQNGFAGAVPTATGGSYTTPPIPPTVKSKELLIPPIPYDARYASYRATDIDPATSRPYAGAVPIASLNVPAGNPALIMLHSSDGSDITTLATVTQVNNTLTAGNLVAGISTYTWIAANTTNASMDTDTGTPGFQPGVTLANSTSVDPTTPTNATQQGTAGAAGVVGSTGLFTGAQTTSSTAATNGQIAAGFNQMATIDAQGLANVVAAVKAGPTTGGGTPDGLTNTDFNAAFASTKTEMDAKAVDRTNFTTNNVGWTSGAATGAGNSAKTAYLAAVTSTGHGIATTGAPTNYSGGVQLPTSGGGHAFYSSMPWDDASADGAASLVRGFMAWCITIAYVYWCACECYRLETVVTVVPQARGNTVAGTGGQLTAALAATAIAVVLAAAPVALAASFESGMWGSPIGTMHAIFAGGVGTTANIAESLLWEFLPIATALTALNSMFAVKIAGASIVAFSGTVIKWIIPVVVVLLALAPHGARADVTVNVNNAHPNSCTIGVASGGWSTGSTAGALGTGGLSFPPQHGSEYTVGISDDVTGEYRSYTVECLDTGNINVDFGISNSLVTVTHPSTVWWDYFEIGLVAGFTFELFGLTMRLFGRLSGSAETGST